MEKKLKVGIVSHSDFIGGADRAAYRWHCSLIKSPHFTDFFDLKPDFFYRQHRVYKKEKNDGYYRFFEGYERVFAKHQLFSGFTTEQKKRIINGFYRIVLMLVPPVEQKEYMLFSKILRNMKKLGVIGKFKHFLYLRILKLISRFEQKIIVQGMVYLWSFLIQPHAFIEQLVIPNISRRFSLKKSG